MSMFSLTSSAIEVGMLKASLQDLGAGACVTFEGWVRDNNEAKSVKRLEYEAYESVAVKEGERIVL
ncbi:MAG TPA: molybdenum cofactor biosynthesis protein MoaE, partial [Candidatus Hydrogenedentes bacterium]|nr:molybdenum cofactor biosynthesis protein MoaE [Candidatus Hydrogenedentota bacterium]